MHQKKNEPKDSEETKIKHADVRKTYQKQKKRNLLNLETSIATDVVNKLEPSGRNKKIVQLPENWILLKVRPIETKNRPQKNIHQGSEATSAVEDDLSPNKHHLITRIVHATKQVSKDGQILFTTTILVFTVPSNTKLTVLNRSHQNLNKNSSKMRLFTNFKRNTEM